MRQPWRARGRAIIVASLIVALAQVPPVNEGAATLRQLFASWTAESWARLLPRQLEVPSDERAQGSGDSLPAIGPLELRWPDGVELDVPRRFDALTIPPATRPASLLPDSNRVRAGWRTEDR